jgi:hypothetical protein
VESDPLRKPDPASTPEILRKRARGAPRDEPEVGDFRQGSPLSQWALGRYLVGRALTESVGNALLAVAVVVLGLAALAEWALGSTLLAVLLVIIAVGVLILRWILLSIVRRLTGFTQYAPVEQRMKALVDDTRSDVLRELRRVGLPGRVFTLPLLGFRFLGHDRRADTLTRLRNFETERAVPKARLDELHLLLRQAFGGGLES